MSCNLSMPAMITTAELVTTLVTLIEASRSQVAPEHPVAVLLEKPRQSEHGEYACTLALQLAKGLRRPPRQVAEALVAALPDSPWVAKVEIAGPGFINLFLTPEARRLVIGEVLRLGSVFGSSHLNQGEPIQVEFVSSNPTGPLHVGHGRGAAFGASLSNILAKVGYRVQREYYVNDAGRQMDILTVSTWLRYLTAFGSNLAFPDNGYQGDYVRDMALILVSHQGRGLYQSDQAILQQAPWVQQRPGDPDYEAAVEAHMDRLIAAAKALLGAGYRSLLDAVLKIQLEDCQHDLAEFGVTFDRWFSEQSLFDDGSVQRVVERLESAGYLYWKEGARWFRSSAFGDEKDRVVQKENGLYTYFASDIAYHDNKYERGFSRIIDVWGADHHGYIPRVKAALTALDRDTSRLSVPLVQFVSLFRQGEKAQMSTRKGQFVTLRELRNEVGKDAARFFYVLRKSDQHLDFDLDLATSQSQDNPVYYVQYAFARIHSVLTKWSGDPAALAFAETSLLDLPQEYALMQVLRGYPDMIHQAAQELAPHWVAFYLKDLAAQLHSYYNAVPFLVDDPALTQARLALIHAVGLVLQDGMGLLGVEARVTM